MDESATDILADSRGHWSVFAPAVAVGLLYGGAWLTLAAQGRGQDDFTRLLLLICAVGTPLLLVHAWLRFRSASVVVTTGAVVVTRGWPRGSARRIGIEDIAGVEVRRSPLGRLFGAGSLRLRLRDGDVLIVGDLGQPGRVADAIRGRLA